MRGNVCWSIWERVHPSLDASVKVGTASLFKHEEEDEEAPGYGVLFESAI